MKIEYFIDNISQGIFEITDSDSLAYIRKAEVDNYSGESININGTGTAILAGCMIDAINSEGNHQCLIISNYGNKNYKIIKE